MKAGALWPLAIVGVLGVTVAANVVMLVQASGKDAAVVEPDYYRRAVRWDSTLAEERRDRALGWILDARLGPLGRDGAELRARLVARDGAPLAGAAMRVSAIHNLDAGRPVSAALEPLGGGEYRARLPLRHAGLWELRFEVTRGSDRFTASLRRDLAAARGTP